MFGKGQRPRQPVALARRAPVAVGDGIAEQLPGFVQQHKVDGPGVDAQGGGDVPGVLAGFQARQHVLPQAVHLPAEVAVFLHKAVFKAIDFFQVHAAVLHPADDVPAGGRADVDGKMVGQRCTPSRFVSAFSIPDPAAKNKRVIYNKITRLVKRNSPICRCCTNGPGILLALCRIVFCRGCKSSWSSRTRRPRPRPARAGRWCAAAAVRGRGAFAAAVL